MRPDPPPDFERALAGRACPEPSADLRDRILAAVSAEMRTVFCVDGADIPAHRFGPARTIDVAPTITDWLGIAPPRDARGRSALREARRR